MSKRSAKKRVVTGIASAIDKLILTTGNDERQFDEKTEQLFRLYDEAVSKINATWKLKGRSAVKQHYKSLFADLQSGINKVTGNK